ncbi:MAG: DUF4271 domain-containing protein [Mediterranea sp.]|jgi:hypothetical protein|nr:DUF4271 domain-containing protein [Mediterranea sp.]
MMTPESIPAAFEGVLLPFVAKQDDGIALLLLCCFFLSAFVLSRTHNLMLLSGKSFLTNRERNSIFSDTMTFNARYLLFFTLQLCLFVAIILYLYFSELQSGLPMHAHPYSILASYTTICGVFVFLKWLLYRFLGWIFFNKNKISIWINSYATLLCYSSLILFPVVLLLIYLGLRQDITVIIGLFLLLVAKILTLYKWKYLFCHNLFDSLSLILYFCALEIAPLYLLYRGVIELNDYLITNF